MQYMVSASDNSCSASRSLHLTTCMVQCRSRLHTVLDCMLKSTPLVPYLEQMQQLIMQQNAAPQVPPLMSPGMFGHPGPAWSTGFSGDPPAHPAIHPEGMLHRAE